MSKPLNLPLTAPHVAVSLTDRAFTRWTRQNQSPRYGDLVKVGPSLNGFVFSMSDGIVYLLTKRTVYAVLQNGETVGEYIGFEGERADKNIADSVRNHEIINNQVYKLSVSHERLCTAARISSLMNKSVTFDTHQNHTIYTWR